VPLLSVKQRSILPITKSVVKLVQNIFVGVLAKQQLQQKIFLKQNKEIFCFK